jgi:hypothetical protein
MDPQTLKRIFREALAPKAVAANYLVENTDILNPLFSDYEQFRTGIIWMPRDLGILEVILPNFNFNYQYLGKSLSEEVAKEPEADFEVNMVEALVGWRRWIVELELKRLTSQYSHAKVGDATIDRTMVWKPDETARASCGHCKVPSIHHNCGIHALDSQSEASRYMGVLGTVYGWGRYVRGELGWRSEFAYPKEFYTVDEPPEVIEILKLYHVPIYVQQPLCIYDPTEDGYEYRTTEANGDRGTSEVSRTGEEGDEETYY